MGLWYRGVFAGAVVAASLAAGGVASAQTEDEVWFINRGSSTIQFVGSASGNAPTIKGTLAPGLADCRDCAWTPDGRFFLVTNFAADTVSVIDGLNGNTLSNTVAVGDGPYGIIVNPAGTFFEVAAEGAPEINRVSIPGFAALITLDTGVTVHDVVMDPTGLPLSTDQTYYVKDSDPVAATDPGVYPDGSAGEAPSRLFTVDQSFTIEVFAPTPADFDGFDEQGRNDNQAFNDADGDGDASDPGLGGFESGQLAAVDPFNRVFACVISSDTVAAAAPAPFVDEDSNSAVLNVHLLSNITNFEQFFGAGAGGTGGTPDDVIAVAAHPGGSRLYVCTLPRFTQTGLIRSISISGPIVTWAVDPTTIILDTDQAATGIAFTRDGTRGYIIIDRGAAPGLLRTFTCNGDGTIAAAPTTAVVSIGARPTSIATRPIAVEQSKPAEPREQHEEHRCFIAGLRDGALPVLAGTRLAVLWSSVCLMVLGLAWRRARAHGRA